MVSDKNGWPKKAYKNQKFMASREARQLRLLSEYIEPEARFEEFQVRDTVVFFGSARFLPRDEAESRLKALTGGAKRITRVLKYTNYQLVTERGVGNGWALLGDAFGFVDPVFSSGLYIAMDGARHLVRAIEVGTAKAFERYERHTIKHITAWQTIVRYYYDGRLLTLFKVGDQMAGSFIGKIVSPHARKHLPQVFTGEATDGFYSRKLLDFMIRHSLRGQEPRDLMVN